MDPFTQFKEVQKQGWAHFAPLEAWTTPAAARLVRHARVEAGQRVLDVACGTGVVAITARQRGAIVTGLDLTPELLERARENSRLADLNIEWHEGDVEALPFADGTFDAVLSQFGHMFAPRPEIAVAEMLRVLKRGGTLAFSTWPPELFVGRTFALVARYMPAPPPGVAPPHLWGDPNVIRERLLDAVSGVTFDRDRMSVSALTPQHHRVMFERTAGPVIKLIEALTATDAGKLNDFRREYDALVAQYIDDNIARQDYLLTRATKV